MFSAPFNSLAFNAGLVFSVDYSISGISSVTFGGQVFLGARYAISGSTEVVLGVIATPARAHPTSGEGGLLFAGDADPARIIHCEGQGDISITATITLRSDTTVSGMSQIDFAMDAHPYADHMVFGEGAVTFNASAIPLRIIRASDMFAGIIFGGRAVSGNYSEETLQINVILAPGQVLVIDTENYLVTRNGENIIDKHSGAWPWLVSESREIIVQPGSGGQVDTDIMFTEKWL